MSAKVRQPGTSLNAPATRRAALGAGLAAALGLLSEQHAEAGRLSVDLLPHPRARLAHLFHRAGFGATRELLDRYEWIGYEGAVDRLLDYNVVPDPIEVRLGKLDLDLTKRGHLRRWWMVRMAHTTRPLQERMVLFWHGLLTSSFSKVRKPSLMLQQNEFFRANALGNFRDILRGISRDSAMLIYLDGRKSRRQHPNENYARELMELFTMGEGHYTEEDVLEASRAFTGWRVTKEGDVFFKPGAHDYGRKTFLGHSGRFDGDDIVDILVRQRATGEYIGRRLFSFIAYPHPEPDIVSSLADTFFSSGYSIRAVVRQILLSEAFSSPRAYRSLVRSPVDLVVGAHRALGIETDGKMPVWMARQMGQDIFSPPSVAGWPGGESWLNSSTWIYRVNFANAITSRRRAPGVLSLDLPKVVWDNRFKEPREVVQYFLDALLDGELDPAARRLLDSYLFTGVPLTLGRRSLNRKGRALVYLIMASPEYQLM